MNVGHDAAPFRYDGYDVDRALGTLTCHYSIGSRSFTERISFEENGAWDDRSLAAARWVYLLAGVSYYKTAAPLEIDLADTAMSVEDRRFLHSFFVDGLAEFAFVNDLDMTNLHFVGIESESAKNEIAKSTVNDSSKSDRPLVPFGGGIDSIVTVEDVRQRHPDSALFVVNRPGDRFEAIERPADVTGLPIIRAEREIDPILLSRREPGFFNGHVPVTGIISAIAVLAALLDDRNTVVMSNERSASAATRIHRGHEINHQWSKSMAFEQGFRRVLEASLGRDIDYYSYLRPCSELWVARRFATLDRYHSVFRSCNRSFAIDRERRLDRWCGTCDKCCFIDLILAPFLEPPALRAIFDGSEPLSNPDLLSRFRSLLGFSLAVEEEKPFECVGDEEECRTAVVMAAERADRCSTATLLVLNGDVRDKNATHDVTTNFLRPTGEHFVPDADSPVDQLV